MAEQRKIEERLLDYSAPVIKLVEALPKTLVGGGIADQLLRSAMSAGANYEEAQGAESKEDFTHKLQIALKELGESGYWLRLLVRSGKVTIKWMGALIDESDQLRAMLSKAVATAKGKPRPRVRINSMARPRPRPKVARISFCLLPFALRLLVCPSLSLAEMPSQVPASQGAHPPDHRVLRAVVQLVAVGPADKEQNRECSATGFLIDEEGYLITNAHVVKDAQRCLEKVPGAKILAKLTIIDSRTAQAVPCDVVGIDGPNDLALLKTERPLLRNPGDNPLYVTLDARAVAVGTVVNVSGYPAFSWQPLTQAGHVTWRGRTRLEEIDYPLPNASDALGVDIHLRPGNSGGPVYRPDGGVIAVVDKRNPVQPTHSVAVAIHYAIALADRYGARWHAAE